MKEATKKDIKNGLMSGDEIANKFSMLFNVLKTNLYK